jgi:hypothetical protein
MRVSSTRMTWIIAFKHIAVVAGHDPATHDQPDTTRR